MSVKYELGKLKIKGEDTFLYGGEFHYFRAPRYTWSERLDQLIDAGCNLVSTYVPWLWHENEEGQIDLVGKTRPEKDLKGFLDLVHEKGLYCIVRPGPYVMAETRHEGIPQWVHKNHPEMVAKKQNGDQHPTKVISYRHPVFLEKVRKWYKEVNNIITPKLVTSNGPVIMYQLCNEVGMLHWVSDTSDFNKETLKEFQDYLTVTFGDIQQFNQTFRVDEDSFSSFVETFQNGLPKDYPHFHYLWRQFFQEHFKNYIGDLRRFAKEDGIDVPFIVNIHGFKDFSVYSRGVDYPIGVSQLYKTAEFDDVVLAGDFYPGHIGYDTYHDLVLASTFTRSVSNKDQPLFSAEFQSGRLADRPRLYPQDLDLNTRTCVAHGMNALNYYMFVGGENYENIGLFGKRHEWQAPIASDGSLRPNYDKAKHLGHLYKTIGNRLMYADKQVKTYVAFNPDDYLNDVVDPRDKVVVDEIANKREHFAFDGMLRLLTAANIPFEAVNVLNPISAEDVPSLWVFSTGYMSEKLQQNLLNYVTTGGKLMLYPEVPDRNLKGDPCRILADGLKIGDWGLVPGNSVVNILGTDSVFVKQRMNFDSNEGDILATYNLDGQDEVSAFKKPIGDGEVTVLGMALAHDYNYHLDVIADIAKESGIAAEWTSDNQNFSIVERKNGDETFLFVHNYDEIEQSGVIYQSGKPAFDGKELTVPPRSGSVFLQNYKVSDHITIAFSTVELTNITVTNDDVQIALTPIIREGQLKLNLAGHWSTNVNTQPQNGVLHLRNLNKPLVLTLKKQTVTVN